MKIPIIEDQQISVKVEGLLPAPVDQHTAPVPFYESGKKMTHNDAMSGAEPVTILTGPLQVTTSAAVHYLVKFHTDEAIWLCYAADLTEPRVSS